MIFSSIVFLLFFLPIFLILYGVTPNQYKNLTLLAGSLLFYAYGDLNHLWLLMASIVVNYFLGLHLGVGSKSKHKKKRGKRYRKKRLLLAAAIVGNIGVLAFFKGKEGFGAGTGLPLGISFYTFQILSYLIDVYRGEVYRETSLVKFAVYCAMFPRVGSGPIVNYGEVQRALEKRRFCPEGIQSGMKVFVLGLAAKVLLADRIGILWHEAQTTGFVSLSAGMAWLSAIAYSLRLYFDFYGYSLMAVGLGKMLGFAFPENFRMPYMARTVRDFYRRWHITLGRWFCRYVYIPLGGSRRGELRTAGNLLAVWLLTALWHGITPNFLIWGALLWVCIVLERQAERLGLGKRLKVLPHLYLWAVIPVTWMCFAIPDLGQLGTYLGRMFGLTKGINVRQGDWLYALQRYGGLFAAAFAACTPAVKRICVRLRDSRAAELFLAALFWLCVWRITVEGNNPFLYLNF